MNETDNPLKRLLHTSIHDFAEWLLGAKVEDVRTANIELPIEPDPIYADQLFWVTLADDTTKEGESKPEVLFHLEFQGRSSRKPMRFRMLDYLSRTVDLERNVRIHSVVFYIGDGVGARDTGHHQIYGVGNQVTLSWHYDVIHLWKWTPEELFKLQRPGLLPLIGQTKMQNPEEVIPQVFEKITAVPNKEKQHRLLTELIALLTDERMIEMVENLMERDELVLDTPFLRKIRRQAADERRQGREEGHEEGLVKGRKEGREKGREEGINAGKQAERRQSVLELIILKYNPSAYDYVQVQEILLAITSIETLVTIFKMAAKSEDFTTFAKSLEELTEDNDIENINPH